MATQNNSNPFLSIVDLVECSLNILNCLLKFNNGFKCFIDVSRVLKWGAEVGQIPNRKPECTL